MIHGGKQMYQSIRTLPCDRISNRGAPARGYTAGIRFYTAGNYLEKSCLAGTVGADNGDAVTGTDVEADIPEQDIVYIFFRYV